MGSWPRRRLVLVVAVAAPLLGLAGVMAAELAPDGRIAANVTRAMNQGEITDEDRTVSLLGTTADHFAECTAVMLGLGDPSGSLLRQSLFSASSIGCRPAIRELEHFAATGELRPQTDYMRYWHGYAVITRPALTVVGLSGTRWLAFALLAVSIGGFGRSVFVRFGAPATLLVVVPGLLTTDMIAYGWSISHAIGLASAWLGGWFVLGQVSSDRSRTMILSAAAVSGALNAYLDLMVAIPASLALCTVAAGLADLHGRRRVGREPVTAMVLAAAGWAVGMAGMWASKWALAWLFVDRERIVDSVRTQISFRTGGDYEGVTGTRLRALTKNLGEWAGQPLTPAVLAVTAVTLVVLVRRAGRICRDDLMWTAAAVAVGAAPVAGWYLALDNHNQIHFWLTYRSLAIAFGALAAIVAVALGAPFGDRRRARYAGANSDDEIPQENETGGLPDRRPPARLPRS